MAGRPGVSGLALGELSALARKAARGAGLDWGLAEETGRAARWLAAHGLPGVPALADCLEAFDGTGHGARAPVLGAAWRARGGVLCPLTAGAAFSDRALLVPATTSMRGVAHPVLLLPFAAEAARIAGRPVAVEWHGVRVHVSARGAAAEGGDTALGAARAPWLTCRIGAVARDLPPPAHDRAEVRADALARLERLARRTYAPATERSRMAGAGAGLTDND